METTVRNTFSVFFFKRFRFHLSKIDIGHSVFKTCVSKNSTFKTVLVWTISAKTQQKVRVAIPKRINVVGDSSMSEWKESVIFVYLCQAVHLVESSVFSCSKQYYVTCSVILQNTREEYISMTVYQFGTRVWSEMYWALWNSVGFIAIRDFSVWGESDLWSDVWLAMDGVVCFSILLEGGVTVSNNFTKRRQNGFKIGTRNNLATHLS